jgi:hypothetical protein
LSFLILPHLTENPIYAVNQDRFHYGTHLALRKAESFYGRRHAIYFKQQQAPAGLSSAIFFKVI